MLKTETVSLLSVRLSCKENLLLILSLFVLLLTAAGCGKGGATSNNGSVAVIDREAYSVQDDAGRTVTLKAKPKRIVSLTYGTDEIITVLAGTDRIVAYSRHAGDSEISFLKLDDVKKVGKKCQENSEAVFSLHPDLVVISTSTGGDAMKTLESMGIPVYVAMSPKTYDQMKQKVRNLGLALGEAEKTKALLQRMDDRMAALDKKLQSIPDTKRKTAVAFSMTGPMGRKGELFDSMMNLAHVTNGAATVHPLGLKGQISKEQVVQVDPDLFLLPTWNYDKHSSPEAFAKELMEDPAYRNVKAVKNKQMVPVSDRYRYVASHHIVDAVENIAYAVYPELFPEGKPQDQE